MATKRVIIDGLGSVHLVKTRQNKSIRLSVRGNIVRVSMPHFVTYARGIRFLTQNISWVLEHMKTQPLSLLEDGQRIGRFHTLYFVPASNASQPRVSSSRVTVPVKSGLDWQGEEVQSTAKKACIRALRQEAELVLPPRLRTLSEAHGVEYSSVQIKQLKRRWGSCDSKKHIVLNLFLMQLPFELIDYVLCHELTHTIHMDHGVNFWRKLEGFMPDARIRRKQLRAYQTALQ